MNNLRSYNKAMQLLHEVSTPNGFLASGEATTNYQRVWARDGVICGLAALASEDKILIETFKKTLETLAKHQHVLGTIPSNVLLTEARTEVSYGGLAGRVDAVSWFIIGVCQYAYYTKNASFVSKYNSEIEKCFDLLEAWEFNNKHLLYVPLSGNWADEYITEGYVLYDQILRIWALRCYNHFVKSEVLVDKINAIVSQVELNFTPNSLEGKYHERAYSEMHFQDFMPCSFSPAGYKGYFDAFGNSLALLLNIGSEDFQNKIIEYAVSLANETKLGLLPAFWPPVFEQDVDWHLLKNNCKYEFRNYPYEFHNGGSWPMVNGFFGLALVKKNNKNATTILKKINDANAMEHYSFYENFNTDTKQPNGVSKCAWSAAATVMLYQAINTNFKMIL